MSVSAEDDGEGIVDASVPSVALGAGLADELPVGAVPGALTVTPGSVADALGDAPELDVAPLGCAPEAVGVPVPVGDASAAVPTEGVMAFWPTVAEADGDADREGSGEVATSPAEPSPCWPGTGSQGAVELPESSVAPITPA